jgi:transcription-repair coupling factor (superfamily II helicase)
MTFSGLISALTSTREFQGLVDDTHKPQINRELIVPDAATAYAIAALWGAYGAPVFVVTPNAESARRLTDQLTIWCGESAPVMQFPETDNIPFERYVPDMGATHQRLRVLAELRSWRGKGRAPLVIASVPAVSYKTLATGAFDAATHTISAGDRFSISELLLRWTHAGYTIDPTVEVPGTASHRGGILDVYPVSSDSPVRIEFFDDEVESIREFDVDTQRSTVSLKRVLIPPATETLPLFTDRDIVNKALTDMSFERAAAEPRSRIPAEMGRILEGEWPDEISYYAGFFHHGTALDFMPRDTLLIRLRPNAIQDASESADRRMHDLRVSKEGRGEIPVRFPQPHLEWGLLADAIRKPQRKISITPWGVDSEIPGGALRLPLEPAPLTASGIEKAMEVLERRQEESHRTAVLSNHAARIFEVGKEHGLLIQMRDDIEKPLDVGDLVVTQGTLRQGFTVVTDDQRPLGIITDAEIFGVAKERRRVTKRPVRKGPALEQLQPGAYVVHIEHGIGKFTGAQVMGDEGREYLVLEYAEDDKLYVPTEHLDRIQLYHGPTDTAPKLTRLGTQEWSRARARAKRATEQLAGELIALYAAREVTEGLSASPDTPWQDALEASFPYQETPDQLTTLEQVKKDLESPHPMDRLVCGDVGYGKTEIALRAAFKVVQSGRQVGILVPTTVLAQQHFETFNERLDPFPASVELLSRFRSDAEQKDVVKRLADGSVDIVIGTHRMLQRDVRFKDLGLIVIDEEHKFGVTHKERLKRLRTQVDVMTLSATPIPRTLQMSLAGIRDMSTIETPPEERLPIKTYVTEESEELVREAVLREVDRGGQVFYLHNRVKDIDLVTARLMKLVPEASFEIGHGQMGEDELEPVMAAFERREFDVLVCTTIIESGIDLPNANTLIVDRADMFGLSQLYQLRGRIGRGANRAYAYLMVPRGKSLTETAEARLNTILAATELGAGFQIALRDLEIRGMGNILGGEQSGHVAAIGFDLYTKLLSDTVADIRAGKSQTREEAQSDLLDFSTVRVDLGMDARVPDSYVEDLAQRLSIYQRLARIHDTSELRDIHEELRDRFGPVPRNVELLLASEKMRVLAEHAGVDSVNFGETRVTLNLKEPTGGARTALQKALGRGVTVGHMQIRVDIDRDEPDWVEELTAVFEGMLIFRERLIAMAKAASAAPEPVAAGD